MGMPTAEEWAAMVSDVFRLHSEFPRKPKNAFRNDGRTPFGTHPVRMAMQFLNEESLLEDDRVIGAKALLGSDIPEDTTSELPLWARDPRVEPLIRGLSFGDGEDKYVHVWTRGEKVILLSFFDNVDGLQCVGGVKPDRLDYKILKVREHLAYVEPRYPRLEMVWIAKGILQKLETFRSQ